MNLYDNLTTTTRKQARYKQGQVTCKSKGRVNTETRICYRSSFSLEKYVSVWRGCGAQCSHEGQRGPPYSPHALTNARCRDPLRGGLEGGNRTFTIQGWGNLHNLIGGSQQTTKLHHNGMWLRGDLFRLGHQRTQE